MADTKDLASEWVAAVTSALEYCKETKPAERKADKAKTPKTPDVMKSFWNNGLTNQPPAVR